MSDNSPSAFADLGVASPIVRLLSDAKITTPTPIQVQAIPVAMEGKDVIGIAQTGTGKTFAFGLPMIQRLALHKGKGLVVLPTRELALQVEESLRKVGGKLHMRTAVLIGGESIGKQKMQLRADPHVIIATPGRLIDHMEQKTVKLDAVRVLVLDEADRMLDMGFAPQINRILAAVPKDRQTMLFSATMPEGIVGIATKALKLAVSIEVAPQGTTAARVTQELFIVPKLDKTRLLGELLKKYTGTVLVFSRTKHGARKLCTTVQGMGHTAAEIHANRSLGQRKEALAGFKNGKYRVLIATDIAARGIDVKDIALVINFDLPDNPDDYVHRIGRTGRAGQEGKAISFATPDQADEVRAIERLIRGKLPLSASAPGTPRTFSAATRAPKQLQRYGRKPDARPPHGPARTPHRPKYHTKQPKTSARGSYGAVNDDQRVISGIRPGRAHYDQDEAPAYRYEPKEE